MPAPPHRSDHVGGIRTLLATGLDQPELAAPVQHPVEAQAREFVLDQPAAVLAQDAVVKAWVFQFEAEGVFQSIRPATATATAACRSVRCSTNCRIVTSINTAGEIPGLPRAPNTPMKSVSANTGPSWSRSRIAGLPFGNAARATTRVCSGTSGHGIGRIDIASAPTPPRPSQHRNTASRKPTTSHKSTRRVNQQDRTPRRLGVRMKAGG